MDASHPSSDPASQGHLLPLKGRRKERVETTVGEARGVINPVSPKLRTFAKGQRSSMTRAEALLWNALRAGRLDGRKFKRQVPIGSYIVDFACVSERLVVELDGVVHETPEAKLADRRRQAWLETQGFTVMRFSSDDVLGNCDAVIRAVRSHFPSPASLRGAPSPAEGARETPARHP